MGRNPDQGEGQQVQRDGPGNNWFTFRRMASNLIKVKDAGASKLRMPQIRGWVAKGSGVEVEDVMVRFGWLRKNGPGAALMLEINEGRIEGSRWTVRGGRKDPVKVTAILLWGDCDPMYEISLKPVDLKVCEFRHKAGGTESINMSRWLDSTKIAEKWE